MGCVVCEGVDDANNTVKLLLCTMLDSGRKKSCQGTLRRLVGSANPAIIPLYLWGLMKMGLFMDSFQQPLLRGKKWDSSGAPVTGADNLVYFGLESQCWLVIVQVSRRIFGSLGIVELQFLGHRLRLQKQTQIIAPARL